jgi:hypothetical protein
MKIASKLILTLLVCTCLTGCAIVDRFKRNNQSTPPQPWITTTPPTLEQIVAGVNRNSQSIRNFTTENASISMTGGIIPLVAKISFERPKRLRIQGSVTSFGSQEFDFGSNDELFWLWLRRNEGVMWFCRHDQFQVSPLRSTIPIDPEWLIEALGIVEFKPMDQHIGPTKLNDGNWEIISYIQTPSGQFVRRTVIDHKVGWVVQQELYNLQNELIAKAQATNLQFDRRTGIYNVKRVEVQCQGMSGKMIIDLGSPTFNRLEPFASSVFTMPTFPGYQAVDIGAPEILQRHGMVMPPNVSEASMQTVIQ